MFGRSMQLNNVIRNDHFIVQQQVVKWVLVPRHKRNVETLYVGNLVRSVDQMLGDKTRIGLKIGAHILNAGAI